MYEPWPREREYEALLAELRHRPTSCRQRHTFLCRHGFWLFLLADLVLTFPVVYWALHGPHVFAVITAIIGLVVGGECITGDMRCETCKEGEF